MALRKRVSDGCEKLIWDFFEGGGQVVVYDANNGTHKARQSIAEKFDKEGIHVILLGKRALAAVIVAHPVQSPYATTRRSSRTTSETSRSRPLTCVCHRVRLIPLIAPQYRGWDPDKAINDYYGRIRNSERSYETITETNWPFIRIFNVGPRDQRPHGADRR
jgi:6-phosphofructo-2-kinase/fructose-2,6-biphosphatase 4